MRRVKLRGRLPKLVKMAKRVLVLGCGNRCVADTVGALVALAVPEFRVVRRTDLASWIVVVKA